MRKRSPPPPAPGQALELHVAPGGDDGWSGKSPLPGPPDGPLATIGGARDRIRSLRGRSGPEGPRLASPEDPVIVWIHDGLYPLAAPLRFGPGDGGPAAYRAAPGAKPVIDGGIRLAGWEAARLNGREAWALDLERAGLWPLPDRRQLFVNGRRATRARLPKTGHFTIEDALFGGEDPGWGPPGRPEFIARQGEFASWRNLPDVEVVAFHYWVDERMPVLGFDPDTRRVTLGAVPRATLSRVRNKGGCPYIVENALDGLGEPGEWAYDGAARRLWYLPRPGERPETSEAVMPGLAQLLQVMGEPGTGAFVDGLRFEGLSFRYAACVLPGEPGGSPAPPGALPDLRRGPAGEWLASGPQGAAEQAGALYLRGARDGAVERCVVEHVGGYAIQLDEGCRGIRLGGNALRDLGAGGISASGGEAASPAALRTGRLRIEDNHIHDGGALSRSGIGILVRHADRCSILHNHVHDLDYSGISVGWVWGYGASVARNHRIAFNHLHDLGKGRLSDMGGIYTLGPQPKTVIRNNLIHGIAAAVYGGWAIYLDEGSSGIVVENNVAYRTDSSVFHLHFGRGNIVRNNLFALGGEGLVAVSRAEPRCGAVFRGNLFFGQSGYVFCGGYGNRLDDPAAFSSDRNLAWDLQGGPPQAAAGRRSTETPVDPAGLGIGWDRWRAMGWDRRSIVADPGLADPRAGEFRLRPDSPAFRLGFRPVSLSRAGPRPGRGPGGDPLPAARGGGAGAGRPEEEGDLQLNTGGARVFSVAGRGRKTKPRSQGGSP